MSSVGLALGRSTKGDSFVTSLVHALAQPLIDSGSRLITASVNDASDEDRIFEHWAEVGGISAVGLLDTRRGDPRVARLRSLGFAVVAIVDTTTPVEVPAVVVDFDASIAVLREFLAARSLPRAIYVARSDAGDATPPHRAAIAAAAAENVFEVLYVAHDTDSAIVTALSAVQSGPATLIFESDIQAAAAFTAARARGLRVPDDVAIISWSSSIVCQSTSRSITAINRRGGEIGTLLGGLALGAIAGEDPGLVSAPEPFVVVGETT